MLVVVFLVFRDQQPFGLRLLDVASESRSIFVREQFLAFLGLRSGR